MNGALRWRSALAGPIGCAISRRRSSGDGGTVLTLDLGPPCLRRTPRDDRITYRCPVLLQNRYGDKAFPVSDRWSNVKLVRALARQRDARAYGRRNLIWMSPAIVVLVVTIAISAALPGGKDDLVFAVGLILFFALLLLIPVFPGLRERSLPRREQQRYWQLTGTPSLTGEQQQLLALDSQSDYAIGAWNSSLAYAPAWSRMPTEVRRAHEQDKRSYFITMPLFAVAAMRADLDQRQHIASSADVELFAVDGLAEASLGARFHSVLHGKDGERMLARLSSLTGWSQWDLRALDEPSSDGHARLLWAADSQRVISIVRMAYLAEHIDEQSAWRMIERAAEPAWGLFDSWETFWANVRVGLAFYSDSLEALQNFDQSLAELRASDWPAVRAPFRSAAVPAWLPTFDRIDEPRDADSL